MLILSTKSQCFAKISKIWGTKGKKGHNEGQFCKINENFRIILGWNLTQMLNYLKKPKSAHTKAHTFPKIHEQSHSKNYAIIGASCGILKKIHYVMHPAVT